MRISSVIETRFVAAIEIGTCNTRIQAQMHTHMHIHKHKHKDICFPLLCLRNPVLFLFYSYSYSVKNATRQQEEVQSSRKKELAQQQRIICVAALEIGTCNTRMGFAFRPLASEATANIVVIYDCWNDSRGLAVPTTILFNHTKEVIAYGSEAESLFHNLSVAERRSVYFFKNLLKCA